MLGENGAGKSTLVKMLFGSLEPNSGEIFWKGEPVAHHQPGRRKKARHRHGVPALLAVRGADRGREHRAVAGRQARRSAPIAAKARALSYSYGLPLDPYSLVGDLSVGERQRIEIIRCLLQTPQLIILDEPTSVLTPQEADKLFETLRAAALGGQVDPLHLAPARRGASASATAPPCCATARWSATAIRARKPPASLARMMVGSEVQAVVRAPVEGIGTARGRCSKSAISAASRRRRSRSR